MTDQELDQMARALGLDGRLDAARHFCASMVSDMEDLSQANKRLVAALDEARQDFRDILGKTDRATIAYYIRYRDWVYQEEP